MSKKNKALLYNFLGFAPFFILFHFLIGKYSSINNIYLIPLTAFVVSTLVSPKFQASNTADGEKIFMRWLFLKGTRIVG